MLIIAAFLLAGAVVNVAVAWWSAFPRPGPWRFTDLAAPSDLVWWETNAPDDFPKLPLEVRLEGRQPELVTQLGSRLAAVQRADLSAWRSLANRMGACVTHAPDLARSSHQQPLLWLRPLAFPLPVSPNSRSCQAEAGQVPRMCLPSR